jgi:adenylate cyclase
MRRRLAAILAADLVGYTSLVGRDESGTLARMKRLRKELIEPLVAAHRGRIVKLMGDGFLIEFRSAVDAVECALAWQRGVVERGEPDLRFRIGINLGDIVIDGGDVHGDGVNIAARLESQAGPGEVLLSGDVQRQVRGKVGAALEDLGERTLRNVAEPVHVYRIAAAQPAAAPRATPSLPDQPSIAVLPFANLSGDAEEDYVADGITEDLIGALARLRWLFVIARHSTFALKGRQGEPGELARGLGVRYLLQGSLRTAAGRVRINAQLIDAASAKQIWAERYDRELSDIFAVQDDITEHVVAAVEPYLYAAEGFRAAGRAPERIDSWGLVVRALGLLNRVERRQNEEARALLGRAIALDPGYARAHALLGWATWWATLCYWQDTRAGYRLAAEQARTALALDASDPWARMVAGMCLSTAGQHERALVELQTALQLNPSFALGHTALGWALLRAGRFDEAIAETGRALRLSPLDSFSGFYTAIHGLALLGARRFADALPYLRASVAAFAEYSGHYNTLISCCGHLGLIAEAEELIAARNRIGPQLRLGVLRDNLAPYAHREVFLEGLAKAGVPE